jgi:hypothetical protein
MNYLEPSEYEIYGLEETTLESWVKTASALIDAHCRRETLTVKQYTERMRLHGTGVLRLTYLPLAADEGAMSPLVSLRVKYGQPRRGEINQLAFDASTAFGMTNEWVTIATEGLDYDAQSGEVPLPVHPLGLLYNEAEITYTAGLAEIPGALKCACAQIVRNAEATPALNVRANGIDHMRMEYFTDSLLDEGVRKLLAPYVAQKVG